MPETSPPPIIPLETLFGNPEKAAAQLSPDGRLMAYLAPDKGVLNVWLRTAGQQDDRAITRDRKRGVRVYFWAFDGRHLLYLQDFEGDENWHVWSVDLTSGEHKIIRDLTPFQGVQAHPLGLDHLHPDEMLVGLNLRDPRLHDVYRVSLSTGAISLDTQNPGDVIGWVADADFQVRASQAANPDGGFTLRVRDSAGADWRDLLVWGPEDEGSPYGFTKDGRRLYVGSTVGVDTNELRLVDVQTGAQETLASNPQVDLGEVLSHPTERHVEAVGFNRDRLKWTVLDPAIAEDLEFLQAQKPGEVHVVSRTLADDRWIVLYHLDRTPAAYYEYFRAGRRLEFLFTARPALEKFALAPMYPVDIPSRDGLALPSYLTLPPWLAAEGIQPSLNSAQLLPTVLNVHGGPWARDAWGYDPEAQWLANRGYACLQVNYRGSTGFGKRFLHAGDREWAGKMHDDLIDSVNWGVERGIADRARVGIFGGSYGGYAALVGAAFTPDVFACAVDIVGPSSIVTLIESIPPYWEPLKHIFRVRVGDVETEQEFLRERSPLYRADQIQCPLLIAQGANDPRVKQAESEQIVEALRSRGKEVEYMLYEDEGHGFARPENRLTFYAAAETFLAKHLGGRTA